MSTSVSQELVAAVTAAVREHMSSYDGSHDFHHILRVVGNAQQIYTRLLQTHPSPSPSHPIPSKALNLDLGIITLSALLHDVGDRKYLQPGQDPARIIRDLLLSLGAPPLLASTVQTICAAVSFHEEMKDRAKVTALIEEHPELAVVQDADRLDSLGAVGMGRVFTFGGAKTDRGMDGSMEMLGLKLYRQEEMMKTRPGKEMARERTERMRVFERWWEEELKNEGVGKDVLSL